jgi:hypothetical protein
VKIKALSIGRIDAKIKAIQGITAGNTTHLVLVGKSESGFDITEFYSISSTFSVICNF